MNKLLIPLFLIIFALAGCKKSSPATQDNNVAKEYAIHYAKGFRVKKYTDYTEVSVVNPWDTAKLLQKYVLIDREKDTPADLPEGITVKVPVNTAAIYNTVQCSTLGELGSAHIIKGAFEPRYIKLESIRKGVENKTIADLGEANKPDIESLIMLSPEVIFASPIVGQTYGNIEKTKIPVIETPDYTEPHPLGRAEWIRFFSLFTGKEEVADSLFNITVNSYNEIKDMAVKAAKKPTVFMDVRFQNSWNMPGGKSFLANMFADAGGNYIWSDDNSTTFLPLSFESVLDRAGEGDVWIIRYYSPEDMTYESLEREYKPYSRFKAFREKNIYGCNTMYSSFYEDLPIHPDYILKDFVKVFHPDLFPDYTLKYYTKLGE